MSGTFAGSKLTFDASIGDGSGLGLKGGGTVTTAGTPVLALDAAVALTRTLPRKACRRAARPM